MNHVVVGPILSIRLGETYKKMRKSHGLSNGKSTPWGADPRIEELISVHQ
jgi:hypothetical protein